MRACEDLRDRLAHCREMARDSNEIDKQIQKHSHKVTHNITKDHINAGQHPTVYRIGILVSL